MLPPVDEVGNGEKRGRGETFSVMSLEGSGRAWLTPLASTTPSICPGGLFQMTNINHGSNRDDRDDHVTNELQSSTNPDSSAPLRRGKWTVEEEAYAHATIRDFNSGYLDAPPGSTLRTYLSQTLECDPMRITKKFKGDASIGKKVGSVLFSETQ